jgi:hypothetical protein
VHTPSAWEWYFEAEKYREADHDAALELLGDAQERFPTTRASSTPSRAGSPMAGDKDAAIASLQAAFELEPKFAKWAESDADLDAIRGLPGSPV